MHCALCESDQPPKLLRGRLLYYPDKPNELIQVCVATRLCIMRYIMNANRNQVNEIHDEMLKYVTLPTI